MEPTDPAPETPAENPAPDAAPEPVAVDAVVAEPSADAASASPEEELAQIVAKAALGRLSPPEEERAARALKTLLLAGKSGLATAAAALPKLAWMIGVNGVTAAWPELKATPKGQLLKALADDESEAARRLRLSLARGLHKIQDEAAALKIGVSVAKDIRHADTGEVTPRNAMMFANVFLGKGKPWCAQLPLVDLKTSESEALVHCAIIAAFTLQHPPVTQLGVLKWAADAGKLDQLDATARGAITKGLAHWNAKWQTALRHEVAGLPEEILAGLKPAENGDAAQDEPDAEANVSAENGDATDDESAPPKPKERPVYVSKTIPSRDQREPRELREPREPREPREIREPREPREPRPPQDAPPARERSAPARSPQFNVSDALRQIDAHVAWLRSEVKAAESRVRPRDEDPRRGRRKIETVAIPGEPSIDELARLNVQLEARIGELQTRIDDLTADSEARAASSGAHSGDTPPSPDAQLRTLLALKLQEGYGDFLALEQESRDLVARQHYRTLLREVFEVLLGEGVVLTAPPEEPTR